MGSLYYPWDEILRGAGLVVKVTDTNAGWEHRSRSSGGFSAAPLGVMWHHAASSTNTSDEDCVDYECNGNDDAPVGNMTMGRDGAFWPIAGGASNCSGKGGPWEMSRGTVALDNGNCQLVNIEVNNNGVGEPWSEQMIDAYFTASNAINAHLGNLPTDLVGHHHYTPGRKIDPATAGGVQGRWQPRSLNDSGTWSLDDMQTEATRRAGAAPEPEPPEEEDMELTPWLVVHPISGEYLNTDLATYATYVDSADVAGQGRDMFGWRAGPGGGPFELGREWASYLDQLPRTRG